MGFMETARSLGARSGREVRMGNVSLELPILDRRAVRDFSVMISLILPENQTVYFPKASSREIYLIKTNLLLITMISFPLTIF